MAYYRAVTGGSGAENVAVGTFEATTSSQAITVGFKPKYLSVNMASSTLRYCLYDEDISKTAYKTTTNSSASYYRNFGTAAPVQLVSINDDGFSFKVSASSVAGTYKYVAVG